MTPRPKPFTFTAWMQSEKDCRSWYQHFMDHNIPAAIIRRDQSPRYSVWRHGVEAGEETRPTRITNDMEPVVWCHGFRQHFHNFREEVALGRKRYTAVVRQA